MGTGGLPAHPWVAVATPAALWAEGTTSLALKQQLSSASRAGPCVSQAAPPPQLPPQWDAHPGTEHQPRLLHAGGALRALNSVTPVGIWRQSRDTPKCRRLVWPETAPARCRERAVQGGQGPGGAAGSWKTSSRADLPSPGRSSCRSHGEGSPFAQCSWSTGTPWEAPAWQPGLGSCELAAWGVSEPVGGSVTLLPRRVVEQPLLPRPAR